MSNSRTIAETLLDVGAVIINPSTPYTYSTGIVSPIYTDLRTLISYTQQRALVVNHLLARIEQDCEVRLIDVVAGVATAAIPYAAWVASALLKPMVYVREATKGHGKRQQIEGVVSKDQEVIIIEDLITTGASALSTASALREKGAKVNHCFSIFTYDLGEANRGFARSRIKLSALTNISELLDVAIATGSVSDVELRAVEEWLAEYDNRGSP